MIRYGSTDSSAAEGVPGIVGGFPKEKKSWWLPRGLIPGLESDSENPNRETTMMKGNYEKRDQPDKAGLRELLARDGREHLLPLVNVFALAGGALDQIIDVIGRAAIEAVLEIGAAEVAGERQPGKKRDGVALGRPRTVRNPLHRSRQPKHGPSEPRSRAISGADGVYRGRAGGTPRRARGRSQAPQGLPVGMKGRDPSRHQPTGAERGCNTDRPPSVAGVRSRNDPCGLPREVT